MKFIINSASQLIDDEQAIEQEIRDLLISRGIPVRTVFLDEKESVYINTIDIFNFNDFITVLKNVGKIIIDPSINTGSLPIITIYNDLVE